MIQSTESYLLPAPGPVYVSPRHEQTKSLNNVSMHTSTHPNAQTPLSIAHFGEPTSIVSPHSQQPHTPTCSDRIAVTSNERGFFNPVSSMALLAEASAAAAEELKIESARMFSRDYYSDSMSECSEGNSDSSATSMSSSGDGFSKDAAVSNINSSFIGSSPCESSNGRESARNSVSSIRSVNNSTSAGSCTSADANIGNPPKEEDPSGQVFGCFSSNDNGLLRRNKLRKRKKPAKELPPPSSHGEEVEQYISKVIHRVHSQSDQRKYEMKPADRRMATLPDGWTRANEINHSERLRHECSKLIRGSQCCGRDCDSRFKNLGEFSKHIDEQHDIEFRPFLCPEKECPWSIVGFHERSECTRHIRTKHYQPMYTCDFPSCYKTYSRSDAFRRHVRQSHGSNVSTVGDE